MSVSLSPLFNGWQGFSSSGLPLDAGLIATYAAGGTVNQATFTTSIGNVQNANPIVLNPDGRPPSEIWLTDGVAYRFDLKDSLGNLIKTYDNITGVGSAVATAITALSATLAATSGSTLVGFTHSNSAAVPDTVEGFIRDTGIINVSDSPWNIVPGATDWATQFMALGAYMRATDTNWNLKFPPGEYLTSRNEWSKGITNLIINGDGATLTNISASGNTFTQSPFVGNFGVFSTVNFGDVYDGGAGTTFGFLFASVAAAQNSITCKTVAQAGNFSPGDHVLLCGLGLQINSVPGNPQFFEWNEVVTASAITGAIVFKYPLQYEYDENWWDLSTGTTCGAPRILNLDRAGQMTHGEYLEINGLTFGRFAGHLNDKCQIEGYDRAVLNNCKGNQVNVSTTRAVELNQCHFAVTVFDKFQESIILNGGDLGNIQQGNGCNNLLIHGGCVVTGASDMAVRSVVIDGAILAGTGQGPTTVSLSVDAFCRNFHIRRARVSPPTSAVVAVTNGSGEETFLIDSVVSNTKILIATATDALAAIACRLRFGKWYALQDGTKRVKITKIYQDDATHMAVEGEFTSIPAPGEIYRADFTEVIVRENLSFYGPYAGSLKLHHSTNAPLGLWDGYKSYIITIDSRDLWRPATLGNNMPFELYLRGRLRRVYTHILTAYTGVSLAPLLLIQARTPGIVTYQSIDALTAGTRESTAFGVNGSAGTDTLVATGGAYVDSMRFILVNGGLYPAYTDPVELPKFEIQVEVLRP